jgi:hypothetical protein
MRAKAVLTELEAPNPGEVTVTTRRASSPASRSMVSIISSTKSSMKEKVAPSAALALMPTVLRSSRGASSAGRVVKSATMSPAQTASMGKASQRCLSKASRLAR